jgi:hypothetical protein
VRNNSDPKHPKSDNIKAFQWFIEKFHPQMYCAFIPDKVDGLVDSTHRYHGINQLGDRASNQVVDLRILSNFVKDGTVEGTHKLHIGYQYYYEKFRDKFGKVVRQHENKTYAGAATHSSTIETVPNPDLCPDWTGAPVDSVRPRDNGLRDRRNYHRARNNVVGGKPGKPAHGGAHAGKPAHGGAHAGKPAHGGPHHPGKPGKPGKGGPRHPGKPGKGGKHGGK